MGFSALLMCEYNPVPCQIVTIENYEKRIPIAEREFQKGGRGQDQIELIAGDAAEVLKTLEEPFDFIFMDAAKGPYLSFFPEVLRLLRSGGVSFLTMCLEGMFEYHFAVERRNRTIYKRMWEYLYELKHNEQLVTCLILLGDGVALSTKR